VTVEIDGVEHLIEQLTRSADERLALQILLLAGTLADEHELRALIADAKDQVVPPLTQRAGATARTFTFQGLPGVHGHPTS
jgi:hypothetical protein